MKIGDEVFVHGYVDEIRKDVVIIRNNGGYFGTVKGEIVIADTPRLEVTREEFEKIAKRIKDAPLKLERLTDCGWGKPE